MPLIVKVGGPAHNGALRRSHGKRPQPTIASRLMQHTPVTIPISFVRGMLSGVQARGQSCESFLAGAEIAPELLDQTGARVTAAQYVMLFRLMIDGLDDEGIAFFSRALRRGSYALIARSALGAPNLEMAMRRITRTFQLLQDDVVVELVRDGAEAGLALRFTNPAAAQQTFMHELLLRIFWRLLAWLAASKLPATRFDFSFMSPPYAGSYGRVFPAPLLFGQRQSAFWFEATWMKGPVRRDEAALRVFLMEAQANIILPRRHDAEISLRVRSHLQKTQPAWPDLAATAEAMHMATSTLQRRLASEGTSFQALKDALRRDAAITRLNTSTAPLAALACELGFADSAAFQRAFKSWTGSAPGAYRRGGA